MNRAPVTVLAFVLALGLSACKGEKKADTTPPPLPDTATAAAAPAPTPPPVPAAPAPTAPAAPVAAAQTGIPTSEDFEQEAIDQINPQNIDAELDKLEKEIGK